MRKVKYTSDIMYLMKIEIERSKYMYEGGLLSFSFVLDKKKSQRSVANTGDALLSEPICVSTE